MLGVHAWHEMTALLQVCTVRMWWALRVVYTSGHWIKHIANGSDDTSTVRNGHVGHASIVTLDIPVWHISHFPIWYYGWLITFREESFTAQTQHEQLCEDNNCQRSSSPTEPNEAVATGCGSTPAEVTMAVIDERELTAKDEYEPQFVLMVISMVIWWPIHQRNGKGRSIELNACVSLLHGSACVCNNNMSWWLPPSFAITDTKVDIVHACTLSSYPLPSSCRAGHLSSELLRQQKTLSYETLTQGVAADQLRTEVLVVFPSSLNV